MNQMYTPAVSQFKVAIGQFAPPDMLTGTNGTIVMRSKVPPEQLASALRATVRSTDPQLPLTRRSVIDGSGFRGRSDMPHVSFNTVLISSFAVVAALLALLGIYSVIAFSATMRTHEMAIRMALGSQRLTVLKLVLVSGAKLGLDWLRARSKLWPYLPRG